MPAGTKYGRAERSTGGLFCNKREVKPVPCQGCNFTAIIEKPFWNGILFRSAGRCTACCIDAEMVKHHPGSFYMIGIGGKNDS